MSSTSTTGSAPAPEPSPDRAIVDTMVLYAAGGRSYRQRHKAGLAIVSGADHGELPALVVPDVVLIETMNGLHRDVGHDHALAMLDRLQAGANFHLVRDPRAVWEAGHEIFRTYDQLSLADAVQVASARHHGISYIYSFDSGFDAVEGLTRLDQPENPLAP